MENQYKIYTIPKKKKKGDELWITNYECKKTLSLIDFQKIRVISSPASVKQCFEYKKKADENYTLNESK